VITVTTEKNMAMIRKIRKDLINSKY